MQQNSATVDFSHIMESEIFCQVIQRKVQVNGAFLIRLNVYSLMLFMILC